MITPAPNRRVRHGGRINVASLLVKPLLPLSASVRLRVHRLLEDVMAGAKAVAVDVGVPVPMTLPPRALALPKLAQRFNKLFRPH